MANDKVKIEAEKVVVIQELVVRVAKAVASNKQWASRKAVASAKEVLNGAPWWHRRYDIFKSVKIDSGPDEWVVTVECSKELEDGAWGQERL